MKGLECLCQQVPSLRGDEASVVQSGQPRIPLRIQSSEGLRLRGLGFRVRRAFGATNSAERMPGGVGL